MLKIYKHNKAEQDLIEIWIYSFEKWGPNQADDYLDQLNVALNNIASNPEIGINIDTIRLGYFKYQINKHMVFYQINKSTINIIRVLSNDMDYVQHL